MRRSKEILRTLEKCNGEIARLDAIISIGEQLKKIRAAEMKLDVLLADIDLNKELYNQAWLDGERDPDLIPY